MKCQLPKDITRLCGCERRDELLWEEGSIFNHAPILAGMPGKG